MDYTPLFQERYNSELAKLQMLKNVHLTFKHFDLDCNTMYLSEANMKKASYSSLEIFRHADVVRGSVVYYFEIIQGNNLVIWHALEAYKKKRERTCPQLRGLDRNNTSNILYVGSEKYEFSRRVMEHCGYRHPHTGGLQLCKWAPAIGLKIRIHYSAINQDVVEAIRHIEAVVSKHLNPLVGRREH